MLNEILKSISKLATVIFSLSVLPIFKGGSVSNDKAGHKVAAVERDGRFERISFPVSIEPFYQLLKFNYIQLEVCIIRQFDGFTIRINPPFLQHFIQFPKRTPEI